MTWLASPVRIVLALGLAALVVACSDDEPDEPVLRIDRPASVDREQLEDGADVDDEVVDPDARAG